MGTFRCQGTGVVHRARIYYARRRAETACGQRVAFASPDLDGDGEWSEAYCQWLSDRSGRTHVLCSHCRDREPAWDRRRRLRRLRRSRQGGR